jgi:uncharacterized protein
MARDRTPYDVPIGARVDGTPWQLRIIEHRSGRPGPTTAVLGGMYGDKAMSCLALHAIDRILTASEGLTGTVILAPAVNVPGLEINSRINPDHLSLNRRFPGSDTGFLTDQFAAAISRTILDSADCIVDLHSGTPTMALWYSYDFGDLELSASFGYLPVATGFEHPGQFGTHAATAGSSLVLPEWGGGPLTSLKTGIEGSLNVLKYRGHLAGTATGPATVPLITKRSLMLASVPGVLEANVDASLVGRPLEPGPLGWITNAVTGERIQEFEVKEEGWLLMMATTAPSIVGPGDFAFMTGLATDDLAVPGAS